MTLHLVFHDIYKNQKDIKRKIDITLDYFLELKDALHTLLKNHTTKFSNYTLQFDEGYSSFKDLIMPELHGFPPDRIILAIRTGSIDQKNFLTARDIHTYDSQGIQIISHSVSHPVLALPYTSTPRGGVYRDMPFGEDQLLSENEIFFQLQESKRRLEDILNHAVTSFALPFGGWNDTATAINSKHNLYTTIYTSEAGIDKGHGLFRPRYGIRSSRTIEETIRQIAQLEVK